MSHLAFLVPAVPGHLNPSLALAHELSRRGHRLTFYGPASARARIELAGHAFVPYAQKDFPDHIYEDHLATLARLDGAKALRFTIDLFTRLGIACLAELPDLLLTDKVDALIVDESIYHGGSIADALNLPYITLSNALLLLPERGIPPFFTTWGYANTFLTRLRTRAMWEILRFAVRRSMKMINEFRIKHHLAPFQRLADARSTRAHLCQQVPEFDFPRRTLPNTFHYIGPLHTPDSRPPVPFAWEKLDGRPLIYASMGTLQNRQAETFTTIAEACQALPCQLVLSLGGGSKPQILGKLPGDPIIVEFAPQLELLKKATLCITHAGLNTTLEALAQGLPLVAIPITNDQPGVAARIRHTGTGEFIPLSRLSAKRLRETVSKVLATPSYKAAALTLQQSIRQHPGPTLGADLIEQTLSSRPAVLLANG
jgi:zeaxanthin glucosyltransferase